jgi:hypothetical protein
VVIERRLQSCFELLNSLAGRDGQPLRLDDLVHERRAGFVARLSHPLQPFANPGRRKIAEAGDSFCRFRSSQRFFPPGARIAVGAEVLRDLSSDCGRKRDDKSGDERDLLEHGFSSREAPVARPSSRHTSA